MSPLVKRIHSDICVCILINGGYALAERLIAQAEVQ